MEIPRSFLCPDCNNELKISNGDYLFSYNIECPHGHKQSNIDLDIILEKRQPKHNLFKCKNHRKKICVHCFTCNEDICILCYNDSHKAHKTENFKNLGLDSRGKYDIEFNLNKQKEILHIFLTDLNNFQSKINLYINTFKSELKKHYEFRNELIKNIKQSNTSYIFIENFKLFSNCDADKKIDESIIKFIEKTKFLEKYDYFKIIFESMIKKNKYIEERNIINRINDYINLNLTPLNNKNLFFQNNKNYIRNTSEITIFRESFEKNIGKYKYESIISKKFPFIINKGPIIIDNKFNEDNFSFYCIADNSVIKIKLMNIENIIDENNCIINHINVDNIRALVNLSENKNIVFNLQGKIHIYDDLFKENKIIGKNPRMFNLVKDILKINDNSFVYTLKNDQKINSVIYYMNIEESEDENIEIKEINTNGLTPLPLFYLKDKNILMSLCYKYKYNNVKDTNYFCICLINLNTPYPEIFQTLNINYNENYEQLLFFNCFNDESFYFPITHPTYKNEMFYNIIYISQYKLIKGELIEVSRIKKEEDLSLKRFNSYGN